MAAQALKQRDYLLEKAQDISNTGAWTWDIHKDAWEVSNQWCRIFGVEQAPISLDDILAMVHPDDREAVSGALTKAANGGADFNLTHRIVQRDSGAVRWVKSIGSRYDIHSDTPHIVIGCMQDITDSLSGTLSNTSTETDSPE